MSRTDGLLAEFDHEIETTRRMLERLPQGRSDWKPHERSMSLGRLAAHIAEIPAWGALVLGRDECDLENVPLERSVAPGAEEATAILERSAASFRAAIEAADEASFGRTWALKKGGHTVFAAPKAAALRGMVYSHLVHHRGQLTVYLRLLEVPVPPSYGPTADTPSA